MPMIEISLWKGFGEEKTKKVIEEVTEVFEDLEIPKEAVEVIVREVPKSHWGIGGKPASEKFPEEEP